MFQTIMVPVDLAHAATLDKALETAAMLGRQDGATVTYVGISGAAPSALAQTPAAFADKLRAFAEAQADTHGIATASHPVVSHDPATDLNDTLLHAAENLGADCIVVASHLPTFADRLWPSHGGSLARRARASVFVVRTDDTPAPHPKETS